MVLRSSPASLHGDAVDRDDDVAGLDPRALRRRTLRHPGDQRAARFGRAPNSLAMSGVTLIDVDAEHAALDLAVLDQLVHDAFDHVDRDGEADADVAAAARQDGGVDAHQFAAQIHQRAAGIAGIDGGVGLDEVLIAVGVDAGAPERADDARGHRVLQAEGIADGDDIVSDLELGRIPERHGDQIRLLGLQDGDVRAFVAADDLGGKGPVVEQRDGDFAGVLHHMMIGDDVAVLRVDDDAGARALELALARPRIRRRVEEAPEKRVVEQRVALAGLLLDGAARRDIDHGRAKRA